jgi:formylglycine-generating enzyme required for sulfatase activity
MNSILNSVLELSYNRFSERASDALTRGIEIMRFYGHHQLDTEHIFLALLEQPGGFVSHALFNLGVDVGALHGEVRALLSEFTTTQQGESTIGEESITPRLIDLLITAEKETSKLRDMYFSTEHLLLAVSTEQNTAVSHLLTDNGVTYERIRETIREIRSTEFASNITAMRTLRVFLCHASVDKPAVRELYQRLRADGFEPWLDEEDLLPGQDWQREIPKAVRNSDVVIVCLSRGSINKAGYVQKEIKLALDVADEQPEDTIFLIPLKLEECDVPERLNRWQWVNLFSPNGYERLMRALQVRATGLDSSASPTQLSAAPAPQSKPPAQPVSTASGGVNIEGQHVSVGKDIVGRDKIIQAGTYIEHATIVQSAPSIQDAKATAQPERKADVQTWGGMEFVRIPAGKFLMGSNDDNQLAYDDEKPQHTIKIPYDYWMARYPITNEQFAAFVVVTKYVTTAEKIGGPKGFGGYDPDWRYWRQPLGIDSERKVYDDHPVVLVSWHDAMEYCKWLNTLIANDIGTIKAQLRLPTEAEGEKAARGEYGNEWPWGNEFNKNKCNSFDDGKKGTTPIGAYSPQGDSPYGAADMAGNVWEWCHSLYRPYPYKVDDGREDELSSGSRVARGGSFGDDARRVRAANRRRLVPRLRDDDLGFRVVVAPVLG